MTADTHIRVHICICADYCPAGARGSRPGVPCTHTPHLDCQSKCICAGHQACSQASHPLLGLAPPVWARTPCSCSTLARCMHARSCLYRCAVFPHALCPPDRSTARSLISQIASSAQASASERKRCGMHARCSLKCAARCFKRAPNTWRVECRWRARCGTSDSARRVVGVDASWCVEGRAQLLF